MSRIAHFNSSNMTTRDFGGTGKTLPALRATRVPFRQLCPPHSDSWSVIPGPRRSGVYRPEIGNGVDEMPEGLPIPSWPNSLSPQQLTA
jgi:hypothetical protein